MPLFRSVLGAGALLLAMVCGAASAATLTVTNINDTGVGSLRNAISAAGAGDTIVFAPAVTGTVVLAAPLSINLPLTIQGPGAGNLTLDGHGSVEVMQVSSGGVTLSGLTIAHGSAPGLGGGIVFLSAGTLTISHDVFDDNTGGNGGAIGSQSGTILVDTTTFINNTATVVGGGGIISFASVVVQRSTFAHNSAPVNGAAINIQTGGTLNVTNSTFVTNTSAGLGGALSNLGTTTISDSTFWANKAIGGAALVSNNNNVTLNNNIFADNAGTAGPGALGPAFATASHNVFFNNTNAGVEDDQTGYGGSNFVVAGSEPVDGFGANGGPTQTILPHGVALCEGDAALSPPGVITDQRGFPRTTAVGAGTCLDAGSVQVTGLAIPTMPVPLLALLGGLLAMFGLYWTMQARRGV